MNIVLDQSSGSPRCLPTNSGRPGTLSCLAYTASRINVGRRDDGDDGNGDREQGHEGNIHLIWLSGSRGSGYIFSLCWTSLPHLILGAARVDMATSQQSHVLCGDPFIGIIFSKNIGYRACIPQRSSKASNPAVGIARLSGLDWPVRAPI